ncbi:MAG: phosphohistidine phosphatase SixA [Bacterioplanes sp.]|nr:phosphohistidine phosphatase SixA [Bacterioplanes sp.]
MRIAIIRHGAAHYGQDLDHTRPLTEQGQEQASRLAQWLANNGWQSAELVASPFLRAQQTAQAIAEALPLTRQTQSLLQPDGQPNEVIDWLVLRQTDRILVSHLPLVGRLASLLVDGQVYDQPWSPAECWVLEGDVAASGCMSVVDVWYPALEE